MNKTCLLKYIHVGLSNKVQHCSLKKKKKPDIKDSVTEWLAQKHRDEGLPGKWKQQESKGSDFNIGKSTTKAKKP